MTPPTSPTIGVFDSGFGGLTVLRALLPLIPGAHYIYLGDTARLPYGSKSQTTIARYAVESARFLQSRGADHLVIACNTATALALDEITAAVPIPVTGVISPGAHAAHTALTTPKPAPSPQALPLLNPHTSHLTSQSPTTPSPAPPQILVLATTATVHSHAYRDACATLHLAATEKACPLLVPLIEEGWTDHPVTREVLRIYLREALATCSPEVVILGCTHYPLIAPLISGALQELGSQAKVIDSPQATAQAVAATFANLPTSTQPATFACFATDSTEKFAHLGSQFLGQPIPHAELLDLGG
jgi:glutamate racemase